MLQQWIHGPITEQDGHKQLEAWTFSVNTPIGAIGVSDENDAPGGPR